MSAFGQFASSWSLLHTFPVIQLSFLTKSDLNPLSILLDPFKRTLIVLSPSGRKLFLHLCNIHALTYIPHICMYTYIIHAYEYTYIYTWIHTCIHTYITYTQVYTHSYMHINTYRHTHIYNITYMHTHKNTYTHTGQISHSSSSNKSSSRIRFHSFFQLFWPHLLLSGPLQQASCQSTGSRTLAFALSGRQARSHSVFSLH